MGNSFGCNCGSDVSTANTPFVTASTVITQEMITNDMIRIATKDSEFLFHKKEELRAEYKLKCPFHDIDTSAEGPHCAMIDKGAKIAKQKMESQSAMSISQEELDSVMLSIAEENEKFMKLTRREVHKLLKDRVPGINTHKGSAHREMTKISIARTLKKIYSPSDIRKQKLRSAVRTVVATNKMKQMLQ